jgi:hypothetical protein
MCPPAPILPTPPPSVTALLHRTTNVVEDGTVQEMVGLAMRCSKRLAALPASSNKPAIRARDTKLKKLGFPVVGDNTKPINKKQ